MKRKTPKNDGAHAVKPSGRVIAVYMALKTLRTTLGRLAGIVDGAATAESVAAADHYASTIGGYADVVATQSTRLLTTLHLMRFFAGEPTNDPPKDAQRS